MYIHPARNGIIDQSVADGCVMTMQNRSERWEQLTELVNQAQRRGLASLGADQLDELGALYRQATAALARARSLNRDSQLIAYLNQLVGRAHAIIYGQHSQPRLRLGYLFGVDIPRTFQAHWRYVAVAAAVTLVAATLAYLLVRADPRWSQALLGDSFSGAVEEFATSEQPAGEYFAETAQALGGANFSALLMSNNIQVALKAFAVGVTLGLGTLYVLVMNGLLLGAFLGIGAHYDRLVDLVAVVIPHGAIEIPAILIAGGAGLMMGHALVSPGDRLRRDALRIAALKAVKLAVGTVPVFIVAALIEGLLSPQHRGLFAANEPRFLLGFLAFALLALYFCFGDRILTRQPRPFG